jgi:hypothetical protein
MSALDPEHYGPKPRLGAFSGIEGVHEGIYEAAIGRTVAAVYLGDHKPLRGAEFKNLPGGAFLSEYLIPEFTDGSTLVMQIGSSDTFARPFPARKMQSYRKPRARRNVGRHQVDAFLDRRAFILSLSQSAINGFTISCAANRSKPVTTT